MADEKDNLHHFDRVNADKSIGLTQAEVDVRVANGAVNKSKIHVEKSFGKILKDNALTLFNIVLFSIALLFVGFSIYLGSTGKQDLVHRYFGFSKYGFLGPVLFNIIIGVVQEVRSKNVISKLRIVTEAKASVMRDGELKNIPASEIVLDDIIYFKPGEQVMTDCWVIDGEAEVDESLLTGESNTVKKTSAEGRNKLFSGSAIMSGTLIARVRRVGDDTYANELSRKVKNISKKKSELMRNIYGILNTMAIVLVIIVAVVIATMLWKIAIYGDDPTVFDPPISLDSPAGWAQLLITTSAFAIGVIPTGLALATTLSLAVSVVALATQKTLIQELYSLENLSRVDTICLDKTGTLTDGSMHLVEVLYESSNHEETNNLISGLLGAMKDDNQTSLALKERFIPNKDLKTKSVVPFSSARKYSQVTLKDGTLLRLGAPEMLLKDGIVNEEAQEKQKEGMRVVCFTRNEECLALVVLKDGIRKSAEGTIKYFNENGVAVKIISGDAAKTVSKIASICGVIDADKAISLEGMDVEEVKKIANEYTVFARVSPEQKEALVTALQESGHNVAMTGDGVNDILALRKANSSITFQKATDAAKACSDVILLDNDFSHLQSVVGEGRRVVNNMQRSSILFLMKTVAITLLAFALIPFKKGQMFFTIENIYLVQTSVIAVGGFLLSLEGSKTPITGTFAKNVYTKALASGLLVFLAALLPCLLNLFGVIKVSANVTSMISILTTIAGMTVMLRNSLPFTKYRLIVFLFVVFATLILAFALPRPYVGGQFLSVKDFADGTIQAEFFQPWNSSVFKNFNAEPITYWIMLAFVLFALPLYALTIYLSEKFMKRNLNKVEASVDIASRM